MRKVCLFIAMSLDGYIADQNGGVDWLRGQDDDAEEMDSYDEFSKRIDTVIMGWNTYHQIVTELSPHEWVYDPFITYVFSHHAPASSERIRFVNTDPGKLVKQLKEEKGKDIWICGGADLVGQLMNENLIDEYHITIIPTLLSGGIRLFETVGGQPIRLRLLDTNVSNGMVELVYVRK